VTCQLRIARPELALLLVSSISQILASRFHIEIRYITVDDDFCFRSSLNTWHGPWLLQTFRHLHLDGDYSQFQKGFESAPVKRSLFRIEIMFEPLSMIALVFHSSTSTARNSLPSLV